MIRKTIIKDKEPKNLKGKDITYNITEGKYIIGQYVDESISDNICNALSDYYNLMHLIKNSWSNKKFYLKMDGAGYNIYDDKNDELQAWIGVKEKYKFIMFFLFAGGALYEKAYKGFNVHKNSKGYIEIFDWDEDIWIYSELNITDILREKKVSGQKKIIKEWIKKNIEKIL